MDRQVRPAALEQIVFSIDLSGEANFLSAIP